MTFYILAVTLPVFVKETLDGNQQQIGLVMTTFIIAAVIFRPLAGRWMDELDQKKITLLSLGLFMLSTTIYGFVDNIYALLALRMVHGIGFGIAATATGALAVEFVPEHRKGEGIGYFSLFMSIAMVVGPFVGLTIITVLNDTVLFIFCMFSSLLSLICGLFTRFQKQNKTGKAKKPVITGWRKLIEPAALPISVAASFLAFSYGSITTFISVYAQESGLGSYASYFFVVFATMIILSRPFTGKAFDRFGEHVLVYPGILLFTIGMFFLSQAHSGFVFLLTGGMLGLGFGALLPSFQTIAVQAAPANRRGMATGTFFVLFDTGYGIGSYLLGVIASLSSYHTMYFIASMIVASSAVIYYRLHHRQNKFKARPES